MVKRLGEIKNGPPSQRPSGPRAVLPKEGPFVGRDEELRRLGAALARAAEGQGGATFLTGQPGIGKTRLAREALALAKRWGFTPLEGRAYLPEMGLAYAPLLDAFAPLLRTFQPARLAALAGELPDLGRLFAGIQFPPSVLPMEGLGDPALEKTRLFEAVSRLFERLTLEAPVVLFIDDLQWTDSASLELLHYLARGLRQRRALLVATYSNDALDTPRGLRSLVTSLLRNALAEEIIIPRLAPDAVDKLVRGILGGEPPAALLALLDARASGTPLFIEAVINDLVDSGDLIRSGSCWVLNEEGATALPASVRRLILERLERLAPTDRRVLDLIAIMGDAATHTVLRAASGLSDETLIEALGHLRAAGLMAESKNGLDVVYSMTHPLIQEVASAELPEMARQLAHVAAIRALEELRPDDITCLARHYAAAGSEANPDRALAVLLAAGERARAVYANEEAARHYNAALAIVRKGGGGDLSTLNPPPSTLAMLLERLGEMWERIGRGDAAVGAWNEALILLSEGRERVGDSIAVSRLRYQLAVAEWDHGRFDIAEGHARAGLSALAGHEPCQELANLHFVRFNIFCRLGDVARRVETAAELLAVAERLRSPLVEAEANLVSSISCLYQMDISGVRNYALRALRIAEQTQEVSIHCRAHIALISAGICTGDHGLMQEHTQRGLAVAQRFGAPTLEALLRLYLAHANFVRGAWEESLCCSADALVLARGEGQLRNLAHALAEQAKIRALRGDLSEARACVSEARRICDSGVLVDSYVSGLVHIAEAILALEKGEVEHALAIIRSFFPLAESETTLSGLPPLVRRPVLMLLAEAQVAAGDPQSALETAGKLAGLSLTCTLYDTACASWVEGLARQAMGQPEAASACLARAYEMFTALDMPFEAAKSLLNQAASVSAARPELATRVARQSLATFESLGARRYAECARRLLRGLGASLLATRPTRPVKGTLTERELEVARLVAEGLTTTQIAKRLTLSWRTVDHHLERMYRRLGIGSRAALVRYAVEAGLLSPAAESI